jgi:predicted lipoprotein with Yx(FWY)xxD motif
LAPEISQDSLTKEVVMKNIIASITVLSILLLGGSVAMAAHHAVKIHEKEGVGKYLTDTEGKSLYWFKKDAPGTSACVGPCVEKWPIYYRDAVKAPEGVKAEDFGTITRGDGSKQTTFRGYPLYYWVNDKQAGDTSGQGVNNVWYVIDPANFPPK